MSSNNSTPTLTPKQAEAIRRFNYRYYKARAEHWEEEAAKFAILGQHATALLCENRHLLYLDLANEFAPKPETQLARDFSAQLPSWQEQVEMQEAR